MKAIHDRFPGAPARRSLVRAALGSLALGAAAAVTGLATAAWPAPAQAAFPERTIRIVVPYSAGGGTDIIARRLAERLTTRFGHPVIVENRAGANGIIGTDFVAKSPPDGYTYVLVVNSHLINPVVNRKMPYDTFRDLTPVTMVARSPLVFVTRADTPAESIGAFTKMVRATANSRFTYGSSENMTRLVGVMYVTGEKLDMVHIGYKGGAPLMTDLAGGQVTLGVTSVLTAKNLIDGGKLRAIGLTGDRRSPVLPEVQTMGEAGLKQFDDVYSSYSLFAPSGTPAAVLEQFQQAVAAVVNTPEMTTILAEQAATGIADPVADFNERVKRDAAFWADLARAAKLEAE